MYGHTHKFSIGQLQLQVNWLIFACVAITVITFLRLGFWQLGRAEEKLAAQEAFDAQQRQNPVAFEDLESHFDLADAESIQNLHVMLQGEYQNDRTILMTAQFFNSQIGYEVVTPMRLSVNGSLVLISRGWTSGILPPNTPIHLGPVYGIQTLTGQIHVPDPEQPIYTGQIDATVWPLRIRSLEPEVISTILSEPVFPYVFRLTQDQPGVLVRHWPVTNVDINNNLSYAVQWFCFAIIVLVISFLASTNVINLFRD